MKKFNFNSRRFKHGSMATIMTAGFIVLVVVFNLVAGLILDRIPSKVDLTEDNIYAISEQSIDYVKNIKDDVNIYICSDEATMTSNQYYKQASEVIDRYTQYNSKIKVQYVDILENASFARKYADYNISEGSILLETEKRAKAIAISDFFAQMENSQTGEKKIVSQTEQVMTSAITYVCDEKVVTASILTGHSDIGCAGFTSILEDNNFDIKEQNIATEEISEDADMVVIYAPKTDYTEAELLKLDAFLDNNNEFNKDLIYVASYEQPELPNLEAFLKEWGIEVGAGVLVETNNNNVYVANQNHIIGLDMLNNTVKEDLRSASLPFIGISVRPLIPAFTEQDNRKTLSLLSTYDTAVVKPYNADSSFDPDKEAKAAYSTAMVGTRTRYEGETAIVSNVIVFGSTDFFAQSLISSASYNNNEYTIACINRVIGKTKTVSISDVSFNTTALTINAAQYQACSIAFIIVIPLLLVVVGLVVWLRRRNK